MIAWHMTEHLVLDRDGDLWYLSSPEGLPPRLFYLGPIERVIAGAILSEGLAAEAAECLDQWRDRIDDRAEQEHAWWSGQWSGQVST